MKSYAVRMNELPALSAGSIQLLSVHQDINDAWIAIQQAANDLGMANRVEVKQKEPYEVVIAGPRLRAVLKVVGREELLDRPIEVKSSMLAHIGFDSHQKEFEAKFKSNGAVWRYSDVTEDEFFQVLEAPSVGQMFTLLIKKRKEGKRK